MGTLSLHGAVFSGLGQGEGPVLASGGRRVPLLLPVALVVWAATSYLDTIPTAGSDLALIMGATLIGLVFGTGAGVLTQIYRDTAGVVFARATAAAAVLWVLGCGFRMAFQLFATDGGAETIVRLSTDFHIDPMAWAPAILLMALAEVLSRTVILAWRGRDALVRD